MIRKLDKYSLISLLLFLIVFVFFFTFQSIDLTNAIDGSWQYTLSSLAHGSQKLGIDIYYTYGPLFQRLTTYPTLKDNIVNFFINGFILTLLIAGTSSVFLNFNKIGKKYLSNNFSKFTLVFCLCLLLFSSPIDSLYFLLLFMSLVCINLEQKAWKQLLLVAFLSLFSFYKVSFSISLLLLLPFAYIKLPVKVKNIKPALIRYLTSLLVYVSIFSLLTLSSPVHIIRYLYYGLLNSSAYSEFMSLPFAINKFEVVSFIVVFFGSLFSACIYLLVQKKYRHKINQEIFLFSFMFFGVSYFALKQAIVRNDSHITAFFPFLLLLLIVSSLFVIKSLRINISSRNVFILFCGLSLFMVGLQFYTVNSYPIPYKRTPQVHLNDQFRRITLFVTNNPYYYPAFAHQKKIAGTNLGKLSENTQGVRDYLDAHYARSKEVIFYGNFTTLGDTLGNRPVLYSPFLQNYAAFPPKTFDPIYNSMLDNHPDDLVLVDELEPSINERIPSHELNDFFQNIKHNYKVVYADTDRKLYLLEPISHKAMGCSLISKSTLHKGQPIIIPNTPLEGNEYIRLRIGNASGLPEKLFTTILKSPVYTLSIITPGGAGQRRTMPSTVEHGVAVKPMYYSYSDIVLNTPVDITGVAISGGLEKNKAIDITFDLCKY